MRHRFMSVTQTLLLYSLLLHQFAFICNPLQHKGLRLMARCTLLHQVA